MHNVSKYIQNYIQFYNFDAMITYCQNSKMIIKITRKTLQLKYTSSIELSTLYNSKIHISAFGLHHLCGNFFLLKQGTEYFFVLINIVPQILLIELKFYSLYNIPLFS